ncbi:MAG: hypothetical protein U1E13_10725 [Methylophilaceae bacterium]|nr:hypothetical protein [Methylophilaceae bacterium]
MKKIIAMSLALCALTTLTTLPQVGVGVGVGGGYPYGGGVGIGLGFGPSVPKGALDSKGRDYWRIKNLAPFHITVQSDRTVEKLSTNRRKKVKRFGDFNFIVTGGGQQVKLGSTQHNLNIGLGQNGQLQIVTEWTE